MSTDSRATTLNASYAARGGLIDPTDDALLLTAMPLRVIPLT
jgi:hypothetical protein